MKPEHNYPAMRIFSPMDILEITLAGCRETAMEYASRQNADEKMFAQLCEGDRRILARIEAEEARLDALFREDEARG